MMVGFGTLFAVQAIVHAQQMPIITEREYSVEHRISTIEAKLESQQWMMGMILTGTITLVGELILRLVVKNKGG